MGWRILGVTGTLLLSACVFYVTVSYTHAFWHRSPAPVMQLVKAAVREFFACLLLLPFWPLWMLLGSSYGAVKAGADGEARRPVILLHGLAMNRTNWLWLGRGLGRRGIGPLYATSYFSPQPTRRSAEHLERFIELVRRRERAPRVDIVAHSLGGVVARYYIERLGGARNVGQLITIGAPHRGTALARLGFRVPSVREVRADSALLSELGPPRPRDGVRYTSIWSRADAIIEPPESASITPAGEDCVFDDLGHLSLLLSPRVLDVIARRLAADDSGRAQLGPIPT